MYLMLYFFVSCQEIYRDAKHLYNQINSFYTLGIIVPAQRFDKPLQTLHLFQILIFFKYINTQLTSRCIFYYY